MQVRLGQAGSWREGRVALLRRLAWYLRILGRDEKVHHLVQQILGDLDDLIRYKLGRRCTPLP